MSLFKCCCSDNTNSRGEYESGGILLDHYPSNKKVNFKIYKGQYDDLPPLKPKSTKIFLSSTTKGFLFLIYFLMILCQIIRVFFISTF